MINFLDITYKNTMATGNVATTIYFNRHPTTLIIGVNGAGKSTILDALTFALFGKPFRNINIPSLVNSINGKDLLVEVNFRIGTKLYKVERGLKPNIFNIYCNGAPINQDANKKDYQKVLENQILKMNYKAFTQIVILGSSSFVPFMQLPALDRRVIIEDLLDIEIFSSMNGIVKSTLREIVLDLDTSKIKLDATVAKIELQKKYVEEAKKNNTAILQDTKDEYEENEIQVKKLLADAELVQNHINWLLKQIADEVTTKKKLKTLEGYYHRIDIKKAKQEKDVEFYTKNNSCQTCLQVIQEEFKVEKIENANREIKSYKNALDSMDEEMDKASYRLEEISVLQRKINEHQSEMTRINASVAQIQKHLANLQSEIKELESKKILSDDMQKVSEEFLNELKTLSDKRIGLSDDKKYYEVAATLLKDDGVKTKIIRQYLPVINKLVNKYLAAMDQFINFNIDEEFKESIRSRYRDGFRYENFSEGEKARIDLSLLFTWRTVAKLKNSMNTNLLILDEVFDGSLDTSGTEEILKLLNALGTETNVFVISHKSDILIDKFAHTIKFHKKGNFSEINND